MSEWMPIESAPITNSRDDIWGRMRLMFYSAEIGVNVGDLVRQWQEGSPPVVFISSYHGDAVTNWGVTHWQPLPEPPIDRAEAGRE